MHVAGAQGARVLVASERAGSLLAPTARGGGPPTSGFRWAARWARHVIPLTPKPCGSEQDPAFLLGRGRRRRAGRTGSCEIAGDRRGQRASEDLVVVAQNELLRGQVVAIVAVAKRRRHAKLN